MKEKNNKIIKVLSIISIISFLIIQTIPNVYAASDPLTAINNLSEMLYSIAKGVGVIMCIYAIYNFATSFASHDPNQRLSGVLVFVGGLFLLFAKTIINTIIG